MHLRDQMTKRNNQLFRSETDAWAGIVLLWSDVARVASTGRAEHEILERGVSGLFVHSLSSQPHGGPDH